MALPSRLSMLSPVATLSARHPAQRAIAVAISSIGTEPTTSALQRFRLLSGLGDDLIVGGSGEDLVVGDGHY